MIEQTDNDEAKAFTSSLFPEGSAPRIGRLGPAPPRLIPELPPFLLRNKTRLSWVLVESSDNSTKLETKYSLPSLS